MDNQRFRFELYKGRDTRYTCPNCKRDHVFSRYVDTETKEYVHENVGRCDRESNCGYQYTPMQYFKDNNISVETQSDQFKSGQLPQKPTSYITADLMDASFRSYNQNYLVQYLINIFGDDVVAEVLKKYHVGSSKHWPGSTVFWQVDIRGKIRTGKIILYNPETGKRVKEPFSHITWVQSVLKRSEFQMRQCLFGEHLLKDASLPVALVESEKTAIIASICLPKFIWLATGGLSNLTAEKCSVLSGLTVILFPDVKGYNKWKERAKELSNLMLGTRFEIDDLLEKNASEEERTGGWDVADYLVKSHRKPLTEEEKTLQLLIDKNPLLSKLIETFDLVIDEPLLKT
jgi:hypothetical protein